MAIDVTLLITRLERSGPGNVVFNLTKGLLCQSVQPDIFSLTGRDDPAMVSDLRGRGVKVLTPLDFAVGCRRYTPQILGALLEYKRRYPTAIWHANCLRSLFYSVLAGPRRTVTTCHCVPHEDWPLNKSWLTGKGIAALHYWLLSRADQTVTISPYMKDQLERRNIPSVQLANPIDLSDFIAPTRAIVREVGPTRILHLGHLNRRKNPIVLVQAVAAATRQGAKLELWFVGDGPLRSKIEEASEISGVVAKFHGNVSDPRPYLAAADILVSASKTEGMPMAVLEAMASGLPVILSDIPPHRQFLRDETRGFVHLFSSEQGELIALLESAKNIAKFAHPTDISAWARNTFAMEYIASQYKEIYHGLIYRENKV